VPEVRPGEIGYDPVVGQPEAVAWRSMWACALMPRSAAMAARSIMREKPGADSVAPRSEINANRVDGGL
jgi:hypothetical protein